MAYKWICSKLLETFFKIKTAYSVVFALLKGSEMVNIPSYVDL